MKKILLSVLCLFSVIAMRADEVTFVAAGASYTGSNETVTIEADALPDVVFSSNDIDWVLTQKNSNSSNAKSSNGHVRWYQNDIVNIVPKNGATITGITIAAISSYATVPSVNTGSTEVYGTTITWEGEATDTLTLTSTKQIRFTTFTVTYTAASTGATLEKPAASVETGVIYNPVNVELSSASEGTIYYTTDGTEPTAESSVYSEAVEVSAFGETTTIKACVINGEEFSDVATFSYTLKVADPVFSPEGGVYDKAPQVTLTTETESAIILYMREYAAYGNTDVKVHGGKYWGYSWSMNGDYQSVAIVINAEGDTIWSNVVEESYIISAVKPFKAATEFKAGNYIIAAGSNVAKPASEGYSFGYLYTIDAEPVNEFIQTNGYYAFTFTETDVEGEYTIKDYYGRYLYMSGTYTSFQLADSIDELGDDAVWTVSIDDDCTATITNKGKGNTIAYSSSYKSYGSYTSIGSNELPILYAEREYPSITVSPENNETVGSITTITVTCEDGIQLNENDQLYAYYTIGWSSDGTDLGYGKVSEDGKSVVYNLETPIEANGSYRVTFPAGLFTLNPGGLDYLLSSNTTYTYYVNNPNLLEVEYANPSDNAQVSSLQYLFFQYSHDITASVEGAVLTDEEGKEYALTVAKTDSWGSSFGSDELCLMTEEAITTPGTYTFVLKKGYASNSIGTQLSEDITYTYVVVEGLKVASVSPVADEDGAISQITIEFNKKVYYNNWEFYLYVSDETGNKYVFAMNDDTDYYTNSITFTTTTPITAAGTYSFDLEQYAVYCYNSSWNQETIPTATHTFVIEDEGDNSGDNNGDNSQVGISNVSAGNTGVWVVYNLVGVKVMETADKATIATLPAGIYVVNGAKVVIK